MPFSREKYIWIFCFTFWFLPSNHWQRACTWILYSEFCPWILAIHLCKPLIYFCYWQEQSHIGPNLLLSSSPIVVGKSTAGMATQKDLQELIRILTTGRNKVPMMTAMMKIKSLQSAGLRRYVHLSQHCKRLSNSFARPVPSSFLFSYPTATKGKFRDRNQHLEIASAI